VQEVEDPGQSDVGHRLVDDFLDLHGCHTDGERGTEHRPVLVHRVAGDDRCELHHQPRASIEAAVLQHLVEREVVEDLDQLGGW
jgi:hypothetical protein